MRPGSVISIDDISKSDMPTDKEGLGRILTLEVARVTEAAAIACHNMVGHGDKNKADQFAVDAMRTAFDSLTIDGVVVIGEGEMDEAPMLYIGEKIGTGEGPAVDIAVDPLEGTALAAHNAPNALCTLAIAPRGGLLHAPDIYMDKIAVGSGLPEGIVSLDFSPGENIFRLAEARSVEPSQITACILNRPRHQAMIDAVRATGARVQLITDGDVSAAIAVADEDSEIDIYMGVGGAPEGVLAAAALQCLEGQMQARLCYQDDNDRQRALQLGITDLEKCYYLKDMVCEDVIFAATGVTSGYMLSGVRRLGNFVTTETVVMRSATRTVRWIKARHFRP